MGKPLGKPREMTLCKTPVWGGLSLSFGNVRLVKVIRFKRESLESNLGTREQGRP